MGALSLEKQERRPRPQDATRRESGCTRIVVPRPGLSVAQRGSAGERLLFWLLRLFGCLLPGCDCPGWNYAINARVGDGLSQMLVSVCH